jgi:SAM-dependent methyltransferase
MKYVTRMVASRNLADAEHVLEVGSYDVNGTVRECFGGHYWGVDVRSGPRVDQVVVPGVLPFADERFDVVVSTEMLEHDLRPWQTLSEMHRVMRQSGTLIITCRGFDQRGSFVLHEEPDLWRYSITGLDQLLDEVGLMAVDLRPDPEAPGVFAVAVKKPPHIIDIEIGDRL